MAQIVLRRMRLQFSQDVDLGKLRELVVARRVGGSAGFKKKGRVAESREWLCMTITVVLQKPSGVPGSTPKRLRDLSQLDIAFPRRGWNLMPGRRDSVGQVPPPSARIR